MQLFKPEPLTYFYISRPAPCPYLPGREEQMVFTDLGSNGNAAALHDSLSRAGFRRSQSIAYKPNCQGCQACVPLRILVGEFTLRRSHRRILRRNEDVRCTIVKNTANSEHYTLFQTYIQSRHGGGGMANMSYDDYVAMVQDTPVQTRLTEYRDADGALLGVCLTDLVDDGLSLVYSFFAPDQAHRSLGNHIILNHIEDARARNLPHVYLGYWIEGSRKMSYKASFRPVEVLGPMGWERLKG